MWTRVAILLGLSLAVVKGQATKTSIPLTCVPQQKPGTCLLKSIKVQEKDVIDTTARVSSDKVLLFENSQLEYLPDVLFGKFPMVETLQATAIGLKKLSSNTISKWPYLKHVDLSDNMVGTVPDNVFGLCQNLESIRMANNRLHLLNGITLMGCNKLKQLNVSSNQLIHMDWEPASGLRELEQVDVSNNLLPALTISRYLKKIIARNNHIHKLTTDAGSFIFMVEYLDVSRNRLNNIDTLARFAKLIHIDLSYNRLLSVDFALFKHMHSLRELNLANNNIFEVATSDHKPITLSLVDLSNNELTRLFANDSKGISSTEKLLLENNFLVSFEVTKGLANFPRMRSISLGGNDWVCNDIEATLAELNAKKLTVVATSQKCAPHQILKSGLCCRDLGSTFDELVLLKSEKLAEIQRNSPTKGGSFTSTVKPTFASAPAATQKSNVKVSSPVNAPVSQTNNAEVGKLTNSFSDAEKRTAATDAQLVALRNENTALKSSLKRTQGEIRTLNEKLTRCKSTVNQRTGQTVLID
ncbi:nephrocan-like [Toxorhynchites rutilus septentrionalis]|uniref:nephrocan-like n=1 Tax=Toxorhynchites rutilus septentrionalis TaxID=329112 RepID=UPI00247B0B23|nr:nephrocan-like [Toxorhynchites rutilus septentrionalis]